MSTVPARSSRAEEPLSSWFAAAIPPLVIGVAGSLRLASGWWRGEPLDATLSVLSALVGLSLAVLVGAAIHAAVGLAGLIHRRMRTPRRGR